MQLINLAETIITAYLTCANPGTYGQRTAVRQAELAARDWLAKQDALLRLAMGALDAKDYEGARDAIEEARLT